MLKLTNHNSYASGAQCLKMSPVLLRNFYLNFVQAHRAVSTFLYD